MLHHLAFPAALAAAFCLVLATGSVQGAGLMPGRHLLQVPTNCSAPGDSWTRQAFNCSIPPVYTAQCQVSAPPGPAGTVFCEVVNDDKPNIRTAVTCPVQQCTAVCDLVVLQNFFPADLVFATTELLAAWKPAVPGC